MVSHRLIRCTVSDAVRSTVLLHRSHRVECALTQRGARVHWSSALPGHQIVWTLEVEQGANGVIAHLAVVPARGSLTRLRSRWQRLAVQPLTARELGLIAERATCPVGYLPVRPPRRSA